jgi:hypothetical protein
MTERLLCVKELAAELGRSRFYVFWMKRRGFPMSGGRATLAEARAWLQDHPKPCKSTPLTTAKPQKH